MITPPLTHMAVGALLDEIRAHGRTGVETGAFLLSAHEDPVSVLALAGTAGIVRRKDTFAVSGRAIGQLFDWAAERDLRVVTQAHSHGGRAFLSETDLRHGFSVRGFVTTVIPFFANPPVDADHWGWWRYENGWRREVHGPAVVAGDLTTITFDEEGVRGH